jgi:hypothetical protein
MSSAIKQREAVKRAKRDWAVTTHLHYSDVAIIRVAARQCGLVFCTGEDRSGQLKGWLSQPHEVGDGGRIAFNAAGQDAGLERAWRAQGR